MESIDLVRENLKKSRERVLAHVEDHVADHWYMHRGQLADSRRAAGLTRMWV